MQADASPAPPSPPQPPPQRPRAQSAFAGPRAGTRQVAFGSADALDNGAAAAHGRRLHSEAGAALLAPVATADVVAGPVAEGAPYPATACTAGQPRGCMDSTLWLPPLLPGGDGAHAPTAACARDTASAHAGAAVCEGATADPFLQAPQVPQDRKSAAGKAAARGRKKGAVAAAPGASAARASARTQKHAPAAAAPPPPADAAAAPFAAVYTKKPPKRKEKTGRRTATASPRDLPPGPVPLAAVADVPSLLHSCAHEAAPASPPPPEASIPPLVTFADAAEELAEGSDGTASSSAASSDCEEEELSYLVGRAVGCADAAGGDWHEGQWSSEHPALKLLHPCLLYTSPSPRD